VAEAQRNGGICAYIDAEHALDPVYARAIGVDVDELLISQPDNGEQALEIADVLIRSGALDVIVIDSVAALTPRAEIEGEMGEPNELDGVLCSPLSPTPKVLLGPSGDVRRRGSRVGRVASPRPAWTLVRWNAPHRACSMQYLSVASRERSVVSCRGWLRDG
jgi:hypothetical protein